MYINMNEKIHKYILEGYVEEQARSRVIQDIILYKVSQSSKKDKITIKGGVVMFNLTKMTRRSTLDIDMDFIEYSITDESIKSLFILLNQSNDGVKLIIHQPIRELNHHDYKGKRITFSLKDSFNNIITNAKIDVGVHKNLLIKQDKAYFTLNSLDKTIMLYVNSKEQIFAEKLSSLLHHGIRSTRYKDIYDMFYLISKEEMDATSVKGIVDVIQDKNSYIEAKIIKEKVQTILKNPVFKKNASNPNNNWINADYEFVVDSILEFLSFM